MVEQAQPSQMTVHRNKIPAVPVGSSDLNQGPTTTPTVRRGVVTQNQLLRPNNPQTIKKLFVATYNVRTLSEEEHLCSLNDEIENIKWHVIGLSEVRRPGEKLLKVKNGHLFFTKGRDDNKKRGGVGIMVHRDLERNIKEFHGESDRVISLVITISKRYCLKIIQVYAPTSTSSQEELEKFYDDVQKALQRNKTQFNIIMGDLNAKVGQGTEACLGQYTYGTRNERGDDFVNFAVTNNLHIANTFFKKQKQRRWTWRSPNGEILNEIDFILVDKRDIVQNIEVLTRVNVGSDHRMVRSTIKLNIQKERKKLFRTNPKPIRIDPKDIADFQTDLKNRYDCLERETDPNINRLSVDELHKNLTKPLLGAAKEYQQITSRSTSKFSDKTQDLMKKRRNLKPPTTAREKIEKAELSKLISKNQRQEVRQHNNRVIHEVISQGRGFKMAKKKLSEGKAFMTEILEQDGTITKDRDRILERTREFFQNLYSSKQSQDKQSQEDSTPKSEEIQEVPPVAIFEIEHAIKQLKRNKAPGEDNITPDLLKDAGKYILKKTAELFTECLIQSKIPQEWQCALIILLFKKGNRKDLANYRPISLLPVLYKLFTKILTNRLSQQLDEKQPREQAGFRKGYSTIDHLHTVNQLIEKTSEYNMPLCLAFVDYQKAFDSVETSAVLSALNNQGIDETYIKILSHIYQHNKSVIRLHADSKPFDLQKGVRQGDTISPKLFTACLEEVFKNLDWSDHGIKIDGEFMSNLRFADDIILFAETPAKLQEMLDDLNRESNKIGLKMNLKKTQVMFNTLAGNNLNIVIDNTTLETVSQYTYLGQVITPFPTKETEIKRRITLGWQAFGRASDIFKSKKIPMSLKRQVYDQCILPVMTYGSETFNLTKHLTLKLRTAQRAHEKIMLGITWEDRKTAKWIRQQTKIRDIVETILQLKWNWAGHVARTTDNRWTTRTTQWIPRDRKRNKGRQRTRWREGINKTAGPAWHRMAQDRRKWKTLGKANVQQWTGDG